MAKAAPKPPTKTEVYANIAEKTDLTKRQVAAVFDALNDEIEKALTGRGTRRPSRYMACARLLSSTNQLGPLARTCRTPSVQAS